MGNNPSHHKGNNFPVDNVSAKDCEEFIAKLNQLTGKSFHIPTSAQWEFAAKGGVKSKGYQFSGSNDYNDVALSREGATTRLKSSYPVRSRFPNELGIYDMTGNVSELCMWHPYIDSEAKGQTAPLVNPGESSWKYKKKYVQRGGYYEGSGRFLLISHIGSSISSDNSRAQYIGLRLVLY